MVSRNSLAQEMLLFSKLTRRVEKSGGSDNIADSSSCKTFKNKSFIETKQNINMIIMSEQPVSTVVV